MDLFGAVGDHGVLSHTFGEGLGGWDNRGHHGCITLMSGEAIHCSVVFDGDGDDRRVYIDGDKDYLIKTPYGCRWFFNGDDLAQVIIDTIEGIRPAIFLESENREHQKKNNAESKKVIREFKAASRKAIKDAQLENEMIEQAKSDD